MKLVNLTCPGCGASLEVDEGLKRSICQYCGKVFVVDDEVKRLEITDAEKLGYDFEIGRQKAQAEIAVQQSDATESESSAKNVVKPELEKPKRKTWLWVLGWIFIFPVPLTILMLRNETMNKNLRYGIIAVAWVFYLSVVLFYRPSSSYEKSSTSNSSVAVVAVESSSSASVSSESVQFELPDFSGRNLADVEAELGDKGLVLKYRKADGSNAAVFVSKNWRVDGQEPAAGANLSKGDELILIVTNEQDEKYAAERAEREAQAEQERIQREQEQAEQAAQREAEQRQRNGGFTDSEMTNLRYDVVLPQLDRFFEKTDFPMALYDEIIEDGVVWESGEFDYTDLSGVKHRNQHYDLWYTLDGKVLTFIVGNKALISS